MKAETVATAVRTANPQAAIHIAASIEDAVSASQTLAASQDRKIYVAGGLFLAIEYAVVARGGRAQELNFF
jgi:dihydrofolate synthase/folylpolyglutamate synthase